MSTASKPCRIAIDVRMIDHSGIGTKMPLEESKMIHKFKLKYDWQIDPETLVWR